jgi:DNA-binding NtrC family response regulator
VSTADEERAAITNQGLVFIVDDDAPTRRYVERILVKEGYIVQSFEGASSVLAALDKDADSVDLVLSDYDMPGVNGLELMSRIRERWSDLLVVFLTGQNDLSTGLEAMRRGAYDYLTKPVDPVDILLTVVRRAIERRRLVARNQFLQRQVDISSLNPDIIGESRAIREVLSLVASAAPTDATVLILGESGTGKELIARAIHKQSKRHTKPFVAVNCGALSETVLESELFGHIKGAFTGALATRKGVFEEANGGTLFLDEVGELAPATQVRLLRALQEGMVRAVGASEDRKVDVRVVAATNRDLSEEIEKGTFREDLYYRLDVIAVQMPPLRQRPGDIPLLFHHFLRKHASRLGKNVTGISPDALSQLCAHRWTGNVRELENTVERAIVLAKSDTINVDLLPSVLRQTGRPVAGALEDPRLLLPLADAKAAFEQEYLEKLLERVNGKVSEAARFAGLDPSNLRRLLKRGQSPNDKGDG